MAGTVFCLWPTRPLAMLSQPRLGAMTTGPIQALDPSPVASHALHSRDLFGIKPLWEVSFTKMPSRNGAVGTKICPVPRHTSKPKGSRI